MFLTDVELTFVLVAPTQVYQGQVCKAAIPVETHPDVAEFDITMTASMLVKAVKCLQPASTLGCSFALRHAQFCDQATYSEIMVQQTDARDMWIIGGGGVWRALGGCNRGTGKGRSLGARLQGRLLMVG